MTYSRIIIDSTFDEIFEAWPNQSGEAQSKKAFTVALNNGADINDLKKGCEIYVLDNIGTDPEFIKNLGNFIREDVWKDCLELGNKMLERKASALKVINAWNDACKSHWIKSSSVDASLPMVMKAMADKPFRDNWVSALQKASLIFKYELNSSDMRSKTTLSIRWFCSIAPCKHTVMKIIDGEYGKAVKDRFTLTKVEKIKPIDEKARAVAAAEFKAMFPDYGFKRKRERKPTPTIATNETKKITDAILKSIGASLPIEDEKPEAGQDEPIWFG
jgi:hypothetical protein